MLFAKVVEVLVIHFKGYFVNALYTGLNSHAIVPPFSPLVQIKPMSEGRVVYIDAYAHLRITLLCK